MAGQENNIWLSDSGCDIFDNANVIICIFEVNNSLELILDFLLKIFKIIRNIELPFCKLFIFLHKIDKVNPSYVSLKLDKIMKFFHEQHLYDGKIKIFKSSISQDYFYKTFCNLSGILFELFEKNLAIENFNEFSELKKELSFILENENKGRNSIMNLKVNLNLSENETILHMKKLEAYGLIKTFNGTEDFQITDRAHFFKIGWELEKQYHKKNDLNKKMELIQILLKLDSNPSIIN